MLVQKFADFARRRGDSRIHVDNATPEQTGFYKRMGFEPDPDFVRELQKQGFTQDEIEEIGYTNPSGDVKTVLGEAGDSVNGKLKDLENNG